jgi:hypothetical protein
MKLFRPKFADKTEFGVILVCCYGLKWRLNSSKSKIYTYVTLKYVCVWVEMCLKFENENSSEKVFWTKRGFVKSIPYSSAATASPCGRPDGQKSFG